MKVWWCEEHRAAESAEEGICEIGARIFLVPGPYPKANYPAPCRFVEMQLVPADARMVSGDVIVIEKVDGEWPAWALTAIRKVLSENHFPIAGIDASQILSVLAEGFVLDSPVTARMVSREALERAAKALSDWDIDCAADWWSSDYEHAEGYREYYRNGVRSVLDALSVSDPTKTEPPKDPWDYDP